ncbi:MAG TPA: ABC transporter substrate-binding protein [Anaerolineae bacterium]|nr:ABC transporter substrate-binding protein [Anaerolineae bacterium]
MLRYRLASLLMVSLLLAATLLAGCQRAAPPTAPPTVAPGTGALTPAGSPQRGGALTVAIAADPDGLDPHKTVAAATFQITRNIYDTLVQADDKGRIVPDLALSWEPSADGLTWTFTLREGVKFHNGRTMTADDVKYSFERLLAPETASPRAKDFAVVQSVAAPDAKTVVFTLKAPSAPFLSNLAYGWAAIVPQEAAATLRDQPVGTGPFKVVQWVKDSHVALERFDDYFVPGVPYLDTATFRVITDPSSRMAALRAGEVDVIPELPVQEVAAVRQEADLKIIEVPFNGIQYIAVNNAQPPFDNVKVRQALNHAVDKQAVIDAAQFGIGVPIGSHMPPVTEYYVDLAGRYPYNPEKAKQLLAEAGYPNGLETTMILPQPYDFHIRNGQVVADQLAKVGIKVKLETMEWGTWLKQVYNGRQFALTAIGATGRLDPAPFLSAYVSTSAENMRNYANTQFDELAAQGAVEADAARRREIYAQMQTLLADDAAAVFLLAPLSSVTLRRPVQGWVVYPIDIYDLRTVWKG